ncbi:hypothetical protein WJX73_010742 [Symbiochloris irregularis]|uniref:Cytochrome P450 n=1 Tax=Symbiochloris irregularis TaxID=706552 RepID=A0AAW1NT41_9CHLO
MPGLLLVQAGSDTCTLRDLQRRPDIVIFSKPWIRVPTNGIRAASWDDAFRRVTSIATDGFANAGKLVSPLPSGFPPGPPGNAAVGMLANPLAYLETTQRRHGKVVGLKLGPEAVILVSDQSTAHEVLSTRASSFAKEGTAFFPGSRLAGNGLLVSDGSTWRRQRQLSNPAFRRAAVAVYSEAMEAAARSLAMSTWADGASRDVYADYNALTLDIVTNVLFGWDLPADQANTIVGSIKVAFEFFANQAGIGIPEWIPTPGQQQYIQAVQRLDAVVYGIIEERTRELEQSRREPQCLLDNLLTARDEQGQPMARTALRDELMTLLVAGQETSAVLLAWTTAFLAFNPQVQARAAAEIDEKMRGDVPTAQNTRELPYLESVLLETLRLRPPAYLVGRSCTEAIQVQRYTIPTGTTFLISPYLMHRDRGAWGSDAAAFDPDRWRTVRPNKPLGCLDLMQGLGHNGSYLPFGAGPRNCIGTGFAISEALVVLCTALQRYTFSPQSTAFPQAAARITLRPGPVRLTIRSRRSA